MKYVLIFSTLMLFSTGGYSAQINENCEYCDHCKDQKKNCKGTALTGKGKTPGMELGGSKSKGKKPKAQDVSNQ